MSYKVLLIVISPMSRKKLHFSRQDNIKKKIILVKFEDGHFMGFVVIKLIYIKWLYSNNIKIIE